MEGFLCSKGCNYRGDDHRVDLYDKMDETPLDALADAIVAGRFLRDVSCCLLSAGDSTSVRVSFDTRISTD